MHYNRYECIPLSSYETGIKAIHALKGDDRMVERYAYRASSTKPSGRAIHMGAQLSLVGSLLVGLVAYFIF